MIIHKHREAKRFEQDVAHDLAARRIFLSGAGMEKADVRKKAKFTTQRGIVVRLPTLTFRVEAKTTKFDVYTFRAVDWADLSRVADAAGEMPVFAVRFLSRSVPGELAIIRYGMGLELGWNGWTRSSIEMAATTVLRPNDGVRIEVPARTQPPTRRAETLVALPYKAFIQRVRAHADFA